MNVRHWFLPDSPDLLGMLREQAGITVEGMQALDRWAHGNDSAAAVVQSCDDRADDTKRRLWRGVRDAYSPPFDPEDLFALSAELDDILKAAKDVVREMELMALAPDAPMAQMTQDLAAATGQLADAFDHLGRRAEQATVSADAAITSQRGVEHTYRSAMSALLASNDLRDVVGRREAYRRLSRLAELVLSAAERVWYTVVKEA